MYYFYKLSSCALHKIKINSYVFFFQENILTYWIFFKKYKYIIKIAATGGAERA